MLLGFVKTAECEEELAPREALADALNAALARLDARGD